MLEFIGDALGAIVSGGATGLLGAAISTFGEIHKLKLLNAHEEKMAQIEGENMRLEASIEMQRIEKEGEVAIAIEEGKAFAASYAHDQATYIDKAKGKFTRILFGFVDFFRGIIRPALTIYAAFILTWLGVEIMTLVDGLESGLTQEQIHGLLSQIILVMLYVSTTVILWWFGTRQKIVGPPK